MSASKPAFRSPQLRDGVAVTVSSGTASLEYREQCCDLDYAAEHGREMKVLLHALKQGATVEALGDRVPALSSQLPGFLDELDRLGLLIDREIPIEAGGLTGAEFYRIVHRFAERVRSRHARNAFYDALVNGTASRAQLVGYAIEYYHVVRLAPRLIAPALGHAGSATTHGLLQKFLLSEVGHDRLLLASLHAVGIEREQLEYVVPLPATFAVCAALGVFAAQDPLAFKTALFVYEDVDERFSSAFERRCAELQMPRAFVDPILRHADVNEGSGHGNISQQLLAEVPYVALEEQQVVLKHVAVLIETLVKAEDDILRHYGSEGRHPVEA